MLPLTRTWQRAREERLPQVAGSLTFTTVLSVVPLLAVSFALLTRFPVFQGLKAAIEQHLLKALLPADISRTVLRYLGQFASNAGGLTLVGFLFLLGGAVALLLTVENALNSIWQVKKPRPFLKRVALYLLVLAVGPLLLGASLWTTSFLVDFSIAHVRRLPAWVAFALQLGPVVLGTLALAALFFFMPNAKVRRRDAFAGGLLGSVGVELAKRGFTAWLLKVPTYQAVYGAFAVVPVFLLWVYVSWIITLAAALVTANLGRGGKAAPRANARGAGRPARKPA